MTKLNRRLKRESEKARDINKDLTPQGPGQGQGPDPQGPGQGQGPDPQGQGQGPDPQGPGKGPRLDK